MAIARWTEMAKISYPLSMLADNYLAYLDGNGRSKHTIANFRRVLKSFQVFVAAAGEAGIKDDLCPEVVAAYRSHLVERAYALSSVRVYVQVLKAWTAYLTEERVFRTDPLSRRGLLPKIPNPLPKFLSVEDRDRVAVHLTRPDATSAQSGDLLPAARYRPAGVGTGGAMRCGSGARALRSGGSASDGRRLAIYGSTSISTGAGWRPRAFRRTGSSSATAVTGVTAKRRSASR